MSKKRVQLNSLAPYERVCASCNRVRSTLDFAGRRRMCNHCLETRLHNMVPGSSRTSRGPLARHELYDGAELRPFTGRPGAMDAFSLPSLQFGERVYRRDANPLSLTTKELS